MTSKEIVVDIIERLPENFVRELRHYAAYLSLKAQHEEWSEIALTHLAARYTESEVEYTEEGLKR